MSLTILIIGSGIAGLCSAVTLQQMGLNVKVYEKNTEPVVAGASIIIAPNALQALKPYRISGEIIRQGNPICRLRCQAQKANRTNIESILEDWKNGAVREPPIHQCQKPANEARP